MHATDTYPILLVEDNPVALRILESLLAKEGYQTCSAKNGQEALEYCRNSYFPMVITDMIMPEVNGIELCQAIRKMDLPGYVFIIMVTAVDRKDDVVKGLEAGADDYVTKPFHHAELLARIRTGQRILQLERSLIKANEEVYRLSVKDPLTKLYNRNFINKRLPEEMVRARRYKHPLSLILGDIDHFKQVNDTHGHMTGDRVLAHFGDVLRENIRTKVDWPARWGGEEFLIVLPETNLTGAVIVAERIRKGIAETIMDIDGLSLRITASFGVAGYLTAAIDDVKPEPLLTAADEMLYAAKHQGRNRVVAAPPFDRPAK